MTVELFAKWLLDNFPHNAQLVTTNSLAWNSNEVKLVKMEELPEYFHLKEKPELRGERVERPFLVIHDDRHYDY